MHSNLSKNLSHIKTKPWLNNKCRATIAMRKSTDTRFCAKRQSQPPKLIALGTACSHRLWSRSLLGHSHGQAGWARHYSWREHHTPHYWEARPTDFRDDRQVHLVAGSKCWSHVGLAAQSGKPAVGCLLGKGFEANSMISIAHQFESHPGRVLNVVTTCQKLYNCFFYELT